MTTTVNHHGRQYRLADLAHYLDDDTRETLHMDAFTTGDQPAQAWWDEYVRRYPDDADHAAACAPEIGATP